ncbi:MAG: PIN domain-containing protein [Candidatus Eremiobacteraeota bacterium]|nr:PIN domain-containing protein [Candidatus Eremiobacteraeota bacterium]
MRKKWLLDSYALLAYLKKEENYQKVSEILSSGLEVMMTDINVGEAYYIISRARSPGDAETFLNNILPLLPIRILPCTFPLVIDAARIRAGYTLSCADAFAVAAAKRENAVLVTGDKEFRHVEQLVKIEWI